MSKTRRNDLSGIMKAAWHRFKKSANNAFEYIKKSFSSCLKYAWKCFKNEQDSPEWDGISGCFNPEGI